MIYRFDIIHDEKIPQTSISTGIEVLDQRKLA